MSCAISGQITNWQKLVSYLGLSHSDLLEVRVQDEEQCLQLLRRWRERYREGRALLKMRLVGAGVDFDALLSNMPGGQVQGVEHMAVGMLVCACVWCMFSITSVCTLGYVSSACKHNVIVCALWVCMHACVRACTDVQMRHTHGCGYVSVCVCVC